MKLTLLIAGVLTLHAAESRSEAKTAEGKPNILFILADDMGWSALSCYGNKAVATPNLDRLAKQGMRFADAYADAQCSPTRAAFFSGQYGARTGLFKVNHEQEPPKAFMKPPEALLDMPPETASLAATLRKAGYTTGLAGKWHIADDYSCAALLESDGGKYFDRYGFDFCGPASEKDHLQDKAVTAITDDIIRFIEQAGEKPWFANALHFTTHTALRAPKALVEKHAARGYKRSTGIYGKYDERPTAEYLAMVEHLDNDVGRLLAKLDELGIADKTLVVFTSDNGGMSRVAGNEPLRAGKGSPYEGGIRVPLIARWPGKIKPGSECATPVHTVDWYPTFAAVAGATPSANHKLDGVSLVPLLTQSGVPDRDAIFWHMPTYTVMYGRTPCAVVRKGDWKLIHWFGDYLDPRGFTPADTPYGKLVIGPRTELYNLRDDISETCDLAASNPDKAKELRAALDAWFKETGAAMPVKNPDFEEKNWWRGNVAIHRKPTEKEAAPKSSAPQSSAAPNELPGPVQRLHPGSVSIGGEIGRRIDLTIEKNLLALDCERDFLGPFRERVESPKTAAQRAEFLRSERMLFNGLGETLDAAVFFAAYSKDSRVMALKNRLVDEVLKTQSEDGYMGQFLPSPGNRQFFEGFAAEDAAFLCLALARDGLLFGNTKSVEASERLMDCFIDSARQFGHPGGYNYSTISLCEAALMLHLATGNPKYLDIARHTVLGPERTSQAASLLEWVNDPPFDRGWHDAKLKEEPVGTAGAVSRENRKIWHVYRHLDRLVTQLLLNRVAPDERYLKMTHMIRPMLTSPEKAGMSVTGGIGSHEGWSDDQDSHGHSETCATAYSLRFLEEVMNLEQDLSQGDLMERIFFNTLFAAQAPEGRQLRYFTPFSGSREYYPRDTFCCPGNYRRVLSQLPQQIVYRWGDGVAVNLYTESTATVPLEDGGSVRLKQVTDYPTSGEVKIVVEEVKGGEFPIHLRIPRWCSNPSVKVNGEAVSMDKVRSGIRRAWKAGDTISLSLPMTWRWVRGWGVQEGRAALLHGPQVFTLNPQRNKLPEDMVLRDIVIDPASVTAPQSDSSIRPEGLAVKVRAWRPQRPQSEAPDLDLVLTEYPDPDGREIFFKLSNPGAAVTDELTDSNSKEK